MRVVGSSRPNTAHSLFSFHPPCVCTFDGIIIIGLFGCRSLLGLPVSQFFFFFYFFLFFFLLLLLPTIIQMIMMRFFFFFFFCAKVDAGTASLHLSRPQAAGRRQQEQPTYYIVSIFI
jgi:hypothetical protein